jgi:flavin-dependent dehydrogenase
MNIPGACDIVVVGGGPAGSLAATYLSQKGYHVVLFDKQTHPRYAVGESLIPDFWKYTDAAGVSEEIEAAGFIRKSGGTVNWMGKINTHTFKDFGYSRAAMHIERAEFDHLLIQNARKKGVQIFENVSVTGTQLDDPDNPIVTYRLGDEGSRGTVQCRYVVDASGQSAVIARQLGLRKINQDFRYMAIWGYFTGSRYVAFGGKVHEPEDLGSVPPTTYVTSIAETGDAGWGWHIKLRASTSVGLVFPLDQIKKFKQEDEDWERFFQRKCQDIPVFNHLLEHAAFQEGSVRIIRDYSYLSEQVAGPGYFLVGDAKITASYTTVSSRAASKSPDRSLCRTIKTGVRSANWLKLLSSLNAEM